MLNLSVGRVDSLRMDTRPRDRLTNTTLVTALIAERPTCLPCIAKQCSLSVVAAEIVLTVIQRALEVHRHDAARCQTCGKSGVVFSVERPAG
jgi:hypothetical protein